MKNEGINDETAMNFLDWLTKHKFYSIFLLLLIILGLDKIANHYGKRFN